MNKFAIGAAFVVGVVLGGTSVNLLAMKASKVYLHAIQSEYLAQEELLAVQAQKRHDLNEALTHYNNIVYAMSVPGMGLFKTPEPAWSFWFPFAAVVIDYGMRQDLTTRRAAETRMQAISRGKLGRTLEALGRKDEAQQQYRTAADLMGISVERLKQMIAQIE
jgi:hypothetical protein